MLICLGVFGLLQKSCSGKAEWAGTGGWSRRKAEVFGAEEGSEKRRRERGELVTCPTWLSLCRRKTVTLGMVPAYLEGGSLAWRDLLNRSCCSCRKRRDFCPNLAWQREREWFHVCSLRLGKERCSGDYDLFLLLLWLVLCGSIP